MIYIHLFQGRTDIDQDLEERGSDGPLLGPFDSIHTTFDSHKRVLLLGDSEQWIELLTTEGMIYYDGIFYSDFSIFSERMLATDGYQPVQIEKSKTEIAYDIY